LATNVPPTFSAGTRPETIPSRAALWAENGSHKVPETIACSHPIITGRKSVAPPIAAEPCLGPACPKFARSCAIVKSHAIPISWPPPIRMPFTRQITGLSQPRMDETMSLNRRMYWRYSCGFPA
jgi:hypothetical protein